MKQTLSNLIIYGNIEQNTMFFFKNKTTVYRYISYSLHNTIDKNQKALVIVYNIAKMKYEILDVTLNSKLYDKEIIVL